MVNRSLIGVCFGLVVTLGTAFLLHRAIRGKSFREVEARNAPTKCTSDSCVRYRSLLSAAIEDAMPPCRDFYTHVCGLWSKTQELGKTAIQLMWEDFMKFVMSTLDHLKISSVNQLITQKGLLYLKSCLNVIKVDNVDNVKRVLAKGGIPWPEKNPKPDFLNAILFMSSNVFAPVLLELTIEDNYGRGAYLQWRPTSTYNIRSEELRRLFETRHIRQHLAVSYKAFAGTYNETRLDQLMTNLNGLEEFLKRWKDVVDDLRVFNDSTDILRYTPSVGRKRWDMVLQRYTSDTLPFYKGLSIQNVKYFTDVFAMHKNLGEDTMNDIIETLSVQNLLEYTNGDIQISYYQSKDKAVKSLRDFCLYNVYVLFGYAVNNQFLTMGLYKELKNVINLAESMRRDYPKLVTAFSSDLKGKNRSSYEAFSVRADVFEEAFEILSRSTPSGYPALYKGYPVMTEKPLENWIRIRNYFSGLPFYAEDAHLGMILGGLGTSLAATLFYDHVDRVARQPAEVYERNQRCLSSKPERPNLDLQGAVAAVPIVSALFRKWSKDANLSAFTGDIPPILSSQLPYFAACYLLCARLMGLCSATRRIDIVRTLRVLSVASRTLL
ncbi:hypothetical protein V5799_026915 [Amblyomma americanum]|uniref:Uncharacterized protein n=1 Tax=Amblyomma americanum TaxID=6943 RepID=A0AAQ4DH72_AMBAM